MQDHFNLASLNALPKTALQARLATLTAHFQCASDNSEKAYIESLIYEVKQALALK